MSEKNTKSGIGFVGLLTVAFIVLKLCKVIAWSWLWVLSPIWIWASFVLVCAVVIVICEHMEKKKKSVR